MMSLDMTQGKPLRLIVRFALPFMFSSILQQLYTMTDSVVVGRALGAQAFAAIGSSSFLQWFLLSAIIGLTQGFGVVLAQRFGAKDWQGFRRAVSMSLMLAAGLCALLTLIGLVFLEEALTLLGTPIELRAYVSQYLRALWSGLMLSAIYNVCAAVLRGMGDSRTPFIALVISTALNIVLDILLLMVFGMGVAGAAIATLIAQAVALGYCLRTLWRSQLAKPLREDWALDRPTVRELLRLGMPPMFSHMVISTGELAMQSAINAYGVDFVTGMTASQRYFSLLNIIGSALEGAVVTFVGQNVGAKKLRRALDGTRAAILLGVASALATTALVVIFAKPLIRFFLPTSGAEIVGIGMGALRVEAFFLIALYLLCLYRAAIQGMGDAIVPMISGFLELALRLVWVLWLAERLLGREGLYFTDGITWVGTAVYLIISYYKRRAKIISELEAQAQ
ncbi:MAG: MATE family efflux transporter [Clostridiales bacterium]|nr:MATE family efflux transporter [Clostridiales bacterium]